MKYTSTRSASIITTFEDAIFSGYAPDGGLYVPIELPIIGTDELQKWSSLGYVHLAYEIFRYFIDEEEISNGCLREICSSSFEGFDHPSHAVPVVKVGNFFISELFHGPTYCFKDLGMRVTVGLLSHFASIRMRRITLVVSTTGDTGPAAVKAVADLANPLLTILVHYPKGQISSFQRKQMTTIKSKMVKVAEFEGGGDDMDKPIKSLLAKQDKISEGHYLCGVNSYNFARPMAQIVHHIWTYLRIIEQTGGKIGDEIDIILPTGAMGNIAGGEIARQMGLPVRRYCAAVNENDITFRVMRKGQFHKSDVMIKTLTEAINIQIPYNFERLLFYLTGGNHDLVKEWMTSVDETSKLDLDSSWLEALRKKFDSERVTDEEMCQLMRRILDKYGYFADPHTCVALAAAEKLGYPIDGDLQIPTAILATASPCKFEESVTIALGVENWKRYLSHHCPTKALEISDFEEVVPARYKAVPGMSLEDMQLEWQSQAGAILLELTKQ